MSARRDALATAIARLREVLKAPESDVTRDAAIQRFEFCFELAWKSVQERARDEGLDCQSPRGCLRVAFKTSWIENEQGWLAMLDDRNRTSHTYDEDLAKAVFRRLPNYLAARLIARQIQLLARIQPTLRLSCRGKSASPVRYRRIDNGVSSVE